MILSPKTIKMMLIIATIAILVCAAYEAVLFPMLFPLATGVEYYYRQLLLFSLYPLLGFPILATVTMLLYFLGTPRQQCSRCHSRLPEDFEIGYKCACGAVITSDDLSARKAFFRKENIINKMKIVLAIAAICSFFTAVSYAIKDTQNAMYRNSHSDSYSQRNFSKDTLKKLINSNNATKLEAFISANNYDNNINDTVLLETLFMVKSSKSTNINPTILETLGKHIKNFNTLISTKNSPPLMIAVERGDKDMVEYLLAKGADVNIKNIYKQTPLSIAELLLFEDIKNILIQHGAK